MPTIKVLVVDDDPIFRRLMEQFLTREGATALTAANCQEALRICAAEQPDLVILDIMMPEVDGFEACRQLRAISDVPIIILSACTKPDFVVKGLRCGADDYITKPFHFQVLRARINALLRRTGRIPRSSAGLGDCGGQHLD